MNNNEYLRCKDCKHGFIKEDDLYLVITPDGDWEQECPYCRSTNLEWMSSKVTSPISPMQKLTDEL